MIADWPGLKEAQLHDGRDLAATTDLRAIAKGVAVDLLGASPALLARDVFPGSDKIVADARPDRLRHAKSAGPTDKSAGP